MFEKLTYIVFSQLWFAKLSLVVHKGHKVCVAQMASWHDMHISFTHAAQVYVIWADKY